MRRDYIIEILTPLIGRINAETVVERLESENLLNLHYGNQEVGRVLEAFKKSFGTTKTSKYDRFAALRLTNKHGIDSVMAVVQLLAQKSGERFAPTVNSVSQLEEKWPSVMKFLRNQQVTEVEL